MLDSTFDKLIDVHAAPGSHLSAGAHATFDEALGPVICGEWDNCPWHRPGG